MYNYELSDQFEASNEEPFANLGKVPTVQENIGPVLEENIILDKSLVSSHTTDYICCWLNS